VCSTNDILQSPAALRLRQFIRDRRHAWQVGTPDLEQFERDLHEQMMALERQAMADELSHYDVAAAQIKVAGVIYHPVLESSETYLCAAGPVRVQRHLYRPVGHNAQSICPLELRAGMVAGYWTPQAARVDSFMLAHLTATRADARTDRGLCHCHLEGPLTLPTLVSDKIPRSGSLRRFAAIDAVGGSPRQS